MRCTRTGDTDGARCSHALVPKWLLGIPRAILPGPPRQFVPIVGIIAVAIVGPVSAQDVRVILPADTTIMAGQEQYRIRLIASEASEVSVSVLGPHGTEVERLFTGPVESLVDVHWSVRDPTTDVPIAGQMTIEVVSTAPSNPTQRLRIPLDITPERMDSETLPPPPDTVPVHVAPSSLLPARLALAAGIVSGVAAVALPSIVARDGRGAPIRFVVGGALGAGGVIAYLSHRQAQPDVNAMLENARLRAAWREHVEQVMNENAIQGWRLHIRSGEVMIERGGDR